VYVVNSRDRSWTEIDLDAYEHNINQLKEFLHPGCRWMQIVKADAYGHGAYRIAQEAVRLGAQMLGVANADEGALLRHQGIELPILILSPSLLSEIPQIVQHNLIPSIGSLDFAQQLNDALDAPIDVHINLDSGMGRCGLSRRDVAAFSWKITELQNLTIKGVFSHFASSEKDLDYSALQVVRFMQDIEELACMRPTFKHIANSTGVITALPPWTDMVRLGLLTYGIYSDPSLVDDIELKPVMHFKSRISQIKRAFPGETIGYNRTYKARGYLTYGIVPVGYADGYDYLLSNRGSVLIHGASCPVIGKVSMDMIAVDLQNATRPAVGDEVTLLGSGPLRAEHIAALYGGSPYELVCQIGRRARRYYYARGRQVDSSPLLRRDFVPTDFSDSKLSSIIETAIEQRIQSKEIASMIYDDVLKQFFVNKDREVHYRRDFRHSIVFSEAPQPHQDAYYLAETTLEFDKVLQHPHFVVACATSEDVLERYFQRDDVEYRWLLDGKITLSDEYFSVTEVRVNGGSLRTEASIVDGCLEIVCSHPDLENLRGQSAHFAISTRTLYPKASHQLSVYLIDITRGATISFQHHAAQGAIEPIPIFAGRSKFPVTTTIEHGFMVQSAPDEWIFPTSGVVFVY
jgi:alanine racemase